MGQVISLKSERNNQWFKPWFNILLHTQSNVCATVQGQCLEYLGYKTLPSTQTWKKPNLASLYYKNDQYTSELKMQFNLVFLVLNNESSFIWLHFWQPFYDNWNAEWNIFPNLNWIWLLLNFPLPFYRFKFYTAIRLVVEDKLTFISYQGRWNRGAIAQGRLVDPIWGGGDSVHFVLNLYLLSTDQSY